MKLYFTPKTLKKIIKMLVLFILACVLIYFSKTLVVNAETTTANINSFDITFPTTIQWYDYINNSYISKGNSSQIISITDLNDTLAFSAPSSNLLTSNGGSGATLRFNTDIILQNHSYILYLYLIDIYNTTYSPQYSYLSNVDLCNSDLTSCTGTSNLLFSGPGQKSIFGAYYITNLVYRFTSTTSRSTYGVQVHFSSNNQVEFTSTMPNRGFIGYKLVDVTEYSTNTIEGMIEDNQDSLNALEEDVSILQQTQEETNNKIDEQIQQDKEQHEETMDSIQDNLNDCYTNIFNANSYSANTFTSVDISNNNIIASSSSSWKSLTYKFSVDVSKEYTLYFESPSSSSVYYYTFGDDSNNRLYPGTYKTIKPTTSNLTIYLQANAASTVQFNNLMLVEGSISQFVPYGKEVCLNKLDNVSGSINDLKDNITNSDTTDADNEANNFFNDFESNDFGLSDIITLPLTTIQSITSKSCTPLSLTLPFVNKTFELPCMTTIYSKFEPFYSIYQTITFGVISYWVCVQIYAMVKGFKDPAKDEIEVMDL